MKLKRISLVILFSGVTIIGFNINRSFLAIANASHNACNSEVMWTFIPKALEQEVAGSAYTFLIEDLYEKVAESGLDVQDSSICNSGNRMDAGQCERLIGIGENNRLEKLFYPKVTDHIWNVNGTNISPRCMEEVWQSMDNYQDYEDRSSSGYKNYYMGKHWGNRFALTGSLPKPISSCNNIGTEDSTSINENIFSHTVPEEDNSAYKYDYKNYTLIAEWGPKECSKLVPHFANNCQSLAFVKLDVTYRYPDIQRNTYAHITDSGRAYIVPVTTLMPLEEVIPLIENS